MGKVVHNKVLDAGLAYIKNANTLIVCSAEPTTYALATTTVTAAGYKLADVTLAASAADFTGPADGTTSGRKVTMGAKNSISIDGVAASVSGNATHVALVRVSSVASSQDVLYVTTCTSQSLTGGNKVNVPAWEMEIRDPA